MNPMWLDLPSLAGFIPAPGGKEFHLGPLLIRAYALCLLAGIAAATWLTHVRWTRRGGDGDLVLEVALWGSVAGIVGGRLYHVLTSWNTLGPEWWAPFAVWEGGLGIWGGIALGVLAGAFVVHRAGMSVPHFMDAAAPGIVLGQAIGRLGNWFNQELFGGPTDLPWGLEVDPARRPDGYADQATFHPTFAYEGLWCVGICLLLVWLGARYRTRLRAPALFCLYVALYTLGRIFWELLRIDPSRELLGQRLNFWVALVVCAGAVVAFVMVQRRGPAYDADLPIRHRTARV